eukprot:COSAG05_NODE_621_length_8305_cov_3.479283_1_plen_139_part_00
MFRWNPAALNPGRRCRLVNYDVDRSMLTIEYKDSRMDIDISLVADLKPQGGSLYQFIGEVVSTQPLQLSARVGRNIDGMDTDLYDHALTARRTFEASLPWVNGGSADATGDPNAEKCRGGSAGAAMGGPRGLGSGGGE